MFCVWMYLLGHSSLVSWKIQPESFLAVAVKPIKPTNTSSMKIKLLAISLAIIAASLSFRYLTICNPIARHFYVEAALNDDRSPHISTAEEGDLSPIILGAFKTVGLACIGILVEGLIPAIAAYVTYGQVVLIFRRPKKLLWTSSN